MKFNVYTLSIALGTIFFLFTSSRKNPNNPPTGKTGAPGENTCSTQPSCHTGGVYTGTVTITGIPDTVHFGQVYPLTIINTSNAIRSGFQITCLDSTNVKCGTLASATGVNVVTANNRQYARQSQPRNLSNGFVSWTFNWTAPASANGNKATFYFASLCANFDGDESGDNAIKNTKPVVFAATSPVANPIATAGIELYPTLATDAIHIELKEAGQGQLSLYNTNGQLVLEMALNQSNTLDVSQLSAGTYMANIQTKGGSIVKKFIKR